MSNPITKKSGRPNSRQAILDAAAGLVGEIGAAHLTLEAVAARAGVSKGGLLYNFPNKTALLAGMIESSITEATAVLMSREREGSLTPAALIRCLFEQRLCWLGEAASDPVAHGMLVAMAEEPALLDPLRRFQSTLWEKIKALVPDPDRLWLSWLATEGLIFAGLFRVTPLTIEERNRIADCLIREVDRQLADPLGCDAQHIGKE
jgi:AcrR family transcriptional regulator